VAGFPSLGTSRRNPVETGALAQAGSSSAPSSFGGVVARTAVATGGTLPFRCVIDEAGGVAGV